MTEKIPTTQPGEGSHHQFDPQVEPSDIALAQIIGPIVERAEIHDESVRVALLPNRIRSFNSENHFYPPSSNRVRLAEIMIRRGSQTVRSARLYLGVQPARNGVPFVPVICIGPRTIFGKLAQREGLQADPYDGQISVQENDDLTLTHEQLLRLRGLRSVIQQDDLVVVQRKASFRLTGAAMRHMSEDDETLCLVKHYDKVVDPESGEFFAHILSPRETDPLLPESPVGVIQGLCVTNSPQYEQQHPELRFMSVKQ